MLRVFLLGLMMVLGTSADADDSKARKAWADLEERALLIPGNKGIDFFLGEWLATNDKNLLSLIEIRHDKSVKRADGEAYPFKLLAQNERYVLLFIAENRVFGIKGERRMYYDFVQLSIERETLGSMYYYMRWRRCIPYKKNGEPRYSAEDFARSEAEILELLRTDPGCGPSGKGRHKGEGIFAIHDDIELRYIPQNGDTSQIPFEPDEPRSKEEVYGRPGK